MGDKFCSRYRFKVGDRVKIKKDLIIGEKYGMKYSDVHDVFSELMNEFRGKEATIMEIVDGKYKLDIDMIHYYADEMLNQFVDLRATKDYEVNEDVEKLTNHLLKLIPKQIEDMKKREFDKAINEALDNNDKELFEKLVNEYKEKYDK